MGLRVVESPYLPLIGIYSVVPYLCVRVGRLFGMEQTLALSDASSFSEQCD